MTIALSARDVRLRFASTVALDNLTLTLPTGKITALLGENGAGKTSFIRCCTAIWKPQSGAIEVFGHAPGSPAARSLIGVMPQSTGAWAASTPAMLLRYLATLYAQPQPVSELMELLGIGAFQHTQYRRLSGGQQQAVNLAGALIGRPRLVFLDEPTAGLDVRARHHTWSIVQQVRDSGVAVLLTTHNMEEAGRLADTVSVLHRGSIRANASPAALEQEHGSIERAFLALTRED